MTAYYNEFDPYAAQWLRNLINAGHIAPGVVDTRSIEDVSPSDLHGFTQCHFFAGIGGWSLALRLAGWPDDRPAWTGSCPCQPFSAAGKGAGFADERHLWPAWQHLIAQCAPPVIFGEQVASKAVDTWIDLVHADLEGMGYAFGSVPFPSASVGAPHIRDRNYWMAHTDCRERERLAVMRGNERNGTDAGREEGLGGASARSEAGSLAHTDNDRLQGCPEQTIFGTGRRQERHAAGCGCASLAGRLADTSSAGLSEQHGRGDKPSRFTQADGSADACAINGQWRDADWLSCRDGKWRPVEPGTFPLAHRVSNRVGRLRAYGNAINPAQAAEFIRAYDRPFPTGAR